jgi:small subunit ribosomal protein S6
MNQYEIAVLYHPDLEIDLEKATSKVEKIIADNSGSIVNTDNWGKRKLAYPINKNESAIYVFYTVELPAQNVRKVEAILNITDEVIRFLITRPDLKAIAKAEEAKAEKAKKAAERGEREDEDESETEE